MVGTMDSGHRVEEREDGSVTARLRRVPSFVIEPEMTRARIRWLSFDQSHNNETDQTGRIGDTRWFAKNRGVFAAWLGDRL
jgi:hypothetical protein